jgi:Fe-Mn family superoxide dismutase
MNAILGKWNTKSLEPTSIEASEVERRMGWEYNGMKLHELYFENMTKEKIEMSADSSLMTKINMIYGSLENFKSVFTQIGKTRGIGWVALVKGEREDELFTIWIDEHNTGNFANTKILLIMDVFEHAFLTDYGIKRADYINAFMGVIDWNVVQKRFEK